MKVDILYKVVLRVGMARGRRKGRKGLRRKGRGRKGRGRTRISDRVLNYLITSRAQQNPSNINRKSSPEEEGEEKEENCRHENSIASVGLRQPSTTSLTSLRIVRASISDEDQ